MSNPTVSFTGNLAADPAFLTFGSGNLLKMRVITNEWTKDNNGEFVAKDTSGWNVEVWGRNADKWRNHLKKGSNVTVIGTARERQYEDKQGVKKYIVEIKASNISIDINSIDGKSSGTVLDSDSTEWINSSWNTKKSDAPF